MQLLFGQAEAFAVGAVHHQDDDLKSRDRSALRRLISTGSDLKVKGQTCGLGTSVLQ